MAKGKNNFDKYKKNFDFSNNDNRNKNYNNTNNSHRPDRNNHRSSNNGNGGLFVNPYSFIPISKQKPERADVKKGKLSGKISCTIDVQTPVFIPNTTFDYLENGHRHNVFYSYTDLSSEKKLNREIQTPEKPIVPGSEIRGMIRNVYEQLTNSCFLEVDEFNLPYKRTNEPKELCIMCWNEETGKWVLYYSVKEYYFKGVISGSRLFAGWAKGDTFDSIKKKYTAVCNTYEYGKKNKIAFDPKNKTIIEAENLDYYVHIPVLMASKKELKDKNGNVTKDFNNKPIKVPTVNKQIIYTVPDTEAPHIELDEATLERFELVLGMDENVKGGYTDSGVNKDYNARKIFESYKEHYRNKEPLIVYVDKASKDVEFKDCIIYLSPACMGKEFFENKIPAILEMNAEHNKCENAKTACPACRLFGMVSKNGAVKGRLRFCDAQAVNGTIKYSPEITLPVLASPRISSTEFYLKPPENFTETVTDKYGNTNIIYKGLWNYDYFATYIKVDGENETKRTPYTPELSGRKIYWNRSFNHTNAQKTKMNTSATPIEKGNFTFDIYFDKLTERELENLLFCLELKDSAVENSTAHKIGTGKPIGMGQVKVLVTGISLTEYKMNTVGEIERLDSIYSKNDDTRKEIEQSKEAQYIIKYSSDLKDKALIDYPKGEHMSKGEIVEDIFTWFAKNRGSVSTPKIQQILPDISADDQTLKKYR